MKSPLINYGGYSMVGRHYRGYCEIEIGKAFVYSNHGLHYQPLSGVSLVTKDVKLC